MSRPPRPSHIPTHGGVCASCLVLPPPAPGAAPWRTVLDCLAERLPKVSRADWQQRLSQGQVLDENANPLTPHSPYRAGLRLYYYRQLESEAAIPFEAAVIYQDEHLVVADKPHFLPVVPSGRFVQHTLLVRLQRRLQLTGLSPVHRIDRETAGLVLFSTRPHERAAYHALFRQRTIGKTYEAIAPWRADLRFPLERQSHLSPDPATFFRMTEAAGPVNSHTQIDLLDRRGAWAKYQLTPSTGKRHQLRVHMNALGLPLLGDQFYPHILRGPGHPEDFSQPLRLLARSLRFTDPITGQDRHFQSQQTLHWP